MAELVMTEESSTPSTPASSKWKLYPKSDGYYFLDDAGKELGPLISANGWIPGTGTWSYSSADSPSFVTSVPDADAALMQAGDRIKLTQTSAKYFIVTKIGTPSGGFTPVTIYGGTDYTLANAAITLPNWSHVKNPFGFPINTDKWTVIVTDSNNCAKASPTASVWYGDTGLSSTGPNIVIPIGCWRVFYECIGYVVATPGTATNYGFKITLSTSSSSESDAQFTARKTTALPAMTSATDRFGTHKEKILNLTSKTTYYLNALVGTASADTVGIFGSDVQTVIKAICAYL